MTNYPSIETTDVNASLLIYGFVVLNTDLEISGLKRYTSLK